MVWQQEQATTASLLIRNNGCSSASVGLMAQKLFRHKLMFIWKGHRIPKCSPYVYPHFLQTVP